MSINSHSNSKLRFLCFIWFKIFGASDLCVWLLAIWCFIIFSCQSKCATPTIVTAPNFWKVRLAECASLHLFFLPTDSSSNFWQLFDSSTSMKLCMLLPNSILQGDFLSVLLFKLTKFGECFLSAESPLYGFDSLIDVSHLIVMSKYFCQGYKREFFYVD